MSNIDWKNLPFGYYKTEFNVRCYYRNGEWGKLEASTSEEITMHMAATCLHYGQEAFEGMKAFMGVDGKVRLFRVEENAKRLAHSCEGIMMAELPEKLFAEACKMVVKLNAKFIPPFGTGASLYLRPLIIGTGPQVGVKPANEYLFMVFACPVGPYFKEGFNPVRMQIARDFDRAAPQGTGTFKVGGNYAASLKANERAHHEGFSTVLFLDAREKKYIDEAGPANFFGITGNTYVTPKSESILRSITNMSLRTMAADMGLVVEERQISVDELGDFEEVGACGTAAVITPIKEIVDRETGKTFSYCRDGKAGAWSTKLYNRLQAIQSGQEDDKFNWNTVLSI